MTVCAFLAGIGLTALCMTQPAPAPPVDQAAIEIQQFRRDIDEAEKMADQKLDRLWGRPPRAEPRTEPHAGSN